jgi:hypothetical protein
MKYLFTPLKPVLLNLDKNVCFLDIKVNKDNEVFIIGCDWCSICNGIIETAKQNIINNPLLINRIDFKKLQIFNTQLSRVLSNRNVIPSNVQIKEWCYNTFKQINNNLLLLSLIYLKLELIELRWCPFKRSKETYYRNKDNRYLILNDETVFEVGKILTEHEIITCNNCPNIVNANWKYTKSNTMSIFQPLLDYMMKEINK